MRSILFLTAATVAICSPQIHAQKAPAPEAVTKNLKAALGDQFEVVGIQSATGRRDGKFWLADVKAKKPGDYALHYGKPGYDQGECICHFTVGKEGAIRTLGHLHRETTIAPMACVGDTLIVPIRVQSHDDLYQFRLKTGEVDKYYAPDWNKVVEGITEKEKLEIRNGADKFLKVVKSEVSKSVTRDVSTHINNLNGLFEATAPARHNFMFTFAAKDDKLKVRRHGPEVALEIVRKGEPVRVLVTQWQVEGKHDHVEPAAVQLRVGDRLLVNCGVHGTEVRAEKVAHPAVAVTQKEFAPQKEPFKISAK